MCGIVGYVGPHEALPIILAGLEKLEYRGYDSSGVAISGGSDASGAGKVFVARAPGKLSELRKVLGGRKDYPAYVPGSGLQIGIGHTRWATHGKPTETNAHPHSAGSVSLIHNGIIENYLELRNQLEKEGSVFSSETDTEIAAHLLDKHLKAGLKPFEALKAVCHEVRGSYAFVAIDARHPDRLLVAKNATPIVVGLGEGEAIVASDIPAVLATTRRVIFLEDGDIAEIAVDGLRIENEGKKVTREVQTVTWDPVTAQKGGFKHFMRKEIDEQSRVLADTLRGRVHLKPASVVLNELGLTPEIIQRTQRLLLLGCGTAWHAGLVTKFFVESLVGIPCEVDYSSEFRYRKAIFDEKTLVVAVSQSGETADTLAAIEMVNRAGAASGQASPGIATPTMAICNVVGSSLARKAKHVLFTYAGPEISVASTKAFTTQLVSGLLFAAYLGQAKGVLKAETLLPLLDALVKLPGALGDSLSCEDVVMRVAKEFHSAQDFLFLGRGICYPIALEGALKLKEISYIHAEGYPAGEMKHGPIALIDERMPVVVVLQRSQMILEKAISNLKEAEARGGKIIVVTDATGPGGMTLEQLGLQKYASRIIEVPFLHDLLSPILLTIPMQLLAYHVAVLNGTDVDLPRNLAKSVTVE
jgi:glucosamine--fructose-6-phosphate aminotransferase (isomerizing)